MLETSLLYYNIVIIQSSDLPVGRQVPHKALAIPMKMQACVEGICGMTKG